MADLKKCRKGARVKIIITPVRIREGIEGQIVVYDVALTGGKSSWQETFGTKQLTETFLRGVEAGASMFANRVVITPSVPSEHHIV